MSKTEPEPKSILDVTPLELSILILKIVIAVPIGALFVFMIDGVIGVPILVEKVKYLFGQYYPDFLATLSLSCIGMLFYTLIREAIETIGKRYNNWRATRVSN